MPDYIANKECRALKHVEFQQGKPHIHLLLDITSDTLEYHFRMRRKLNISSPLINENVAGSALFHKLIRSGSQLAGLAPNPQGLLQTQKHNFALCGMQNPPCLKLSDLIVQLSYSVR